MNAQTCFLLVKILGFQIILLCRLFVNYFRMDEHILKLVCFRFFVLKAYFKIMYVYSLFCQQKKNNKYIEKTILKKHE
jgi:hypothetical protein